MEKFVILLAVGLLCLCNSPVAEAGMFRKTVALAPSPSLNSSTAISAEPVQNQKLISILDCLSLASVSQCQASNSGDQLIVFGHCVTVLGQQNCTSLQQSHQYISVLNCVAVLGSQTCAPLTNSTIAILNCINVASVQQCQAYYPNDQLISVANCIVALGNQTCNILPQNQGFISLLNCVLLLGSQTCAPLTSTSTSTSASTSTVTITPTTTITVTLSTSVVTSVITVTSGSTSSSSSTTPGWMSTSGTPPTAWGTPPPAPSTPTPTLPGWSTTTSVSIGWSNEGCGWNATNPVEPSGGWYWTGWSWGWASDLNGANCIKSISSTNIPDLPAVILQKTLEFRLLLQSYYQSCSRPFFDDFTSIVALLRDFSGSGMGWSTKKNLKDGTPVIPQLPDINNLIGLQTDDLRLPEMPLLPDFIGSVDSAPIQEIPQLELPQLPQLPIRSHEEAKAQEDNVLEENEFAVNTNSKAKNFKKIHFEPENVLVELDPSISEYPVYS